MVTLQRPEIETPELLMSLVGFAFATMNTSLAPKTAFMTVIILVIRYILVKKAGCYLDVLYYGLALDARVTNPVRNSRHRDSTSYQP